MKKIDKLILSSFWAPYILSFFVAEFVLVIQFMWRYIDDFLGKGFPLITLGELIFYFAITIIPQAIPLTILISSIMVFGNLSERYELTSMKSAGVSLIRIMSSAILVAILTMCLSFVTSNYLKPKANFKFLSLFHSMRKQKPALSIEEGIFCKDFKDYVIRVGEKDKNDIDIRNVMIYDHTDIDRRLTNVITANDGKMYSDDQSGFIMELFNGNQFKEMKSSRGKGNADKYPLMRTKFERFIKVFDLSQFELSDNLSTTRNKYDMMSQHQLADAIDTIDSKVQNKIKDFNYDFNDLIFFSLKNKEKMKIDSNEKKSGEPQSNFERSKSIIELTNKIKNTPQKQRIQSLSAPTNFTKINYEFQLDTSNINAGGIIYMLPSDKELDALESTVKDVTSFKNRYTNTKATINSFYAQRRQYVLRKHQHFSMALICLIFVFIGAPLGSIIRKGGYGYPLLLAIIFYVVFIISMIMGQKLIKRNDFSAELAAWIPVLILSPFAVIFTMLAINDVKINVISWLQSLFNREKEDLSKSKIKM